MLEVPESLYLMQRADGIPKEISFEISMHLGSALGISHSSLPWCDEG